MEQPPVTGRRPPRGTEQVLAQWLQESEPPAPRRAARVAPGSSSSWCPGEAPGRSPRDVGILVELDSVHYRERRPGRAEGCPDGSADTDMLPLCLDPSRSPPVSSSGPLWLRFSRDSPSSPRGWEWMVSWPRREWYPWGIQLSRIKTFHHSPLFNTRAPVVPLTSRVSIACHSARQT